MTSDAQEPHPERAGLYFHQPACLEHDPRAHVPEHPDTPARLEAIEQRLTEANWLEWERRAAPPASEQMLELIHDAQHVERIEQLSLVGGGAIDSDTIVGKPSYRAALHAAGGACAMTEALMAGETRSASAACAPPAITLNRTARWASACSTTSRSRRSSRSANSGRARVHPRLGRPPRQRDGRGLSPPPRRPLREHPPVADLPRHRSARRRGFGRGRGLHDQPARPAGSEEELWLSLLEHVALPAAAPSRPISC